jgi:hypothetical protein
MELRRLPARPHAGLQESTMPSATDRELNRPPTRTRDDDSILRRRVLAEFREMPGLRLTLNQASRLFDIEPARCGLVLEALVDSGCLAVQDTVFVVPDCRAVLRKPDTSSSAPTASSG